MEELNHSLENRFSVFNKYNWQDVKVELAGKIALRVHHSPYPGQVTANKDAQEGLSPEGNVRILVMDDDEDIRILLGLVLSDVGYVVELAEDGARAVELYKIAGEEGRPFDAVMMDLNVPGGMGGEEAIKKLLEIDPQVKAVLSSGHTGDPVLLNYWQYGFCACVVKPFDIFELLDLLEKLINGETQ